MLLIHLVPLSLSFKIVAMPTQGNEVNIVSLLIGGRTLLHGQLQKISKKVQFDSLGSQGAQLNQTVPLSENSSHQYWD